eukprot:COSAG02_NODE_33830_length_493_cov_1.951777_1_plen_38_part_10
MPMDSNTAGHQHTKVHFSVADGGLGQSLNDRDSVLFLR